MMRNIKYHLTIIFVRLSQIFSIELLMLNT